MDVGEESMVMDEINESEEQTYIYAYYINLIIYRYECDLIQGDKVQQFLETLGRWEGKFKRLSVGKKKMVMSLLMEHLKKEELYE